MSGFYEIHILYAGDPDSRPNLVYGDPVEDIETALHIAFFKLGYHSTAERVLVYFEETEWNSEIAWPPPRYRITRTDPRGDGALGGFPVLEKLNR